MDANIVIPCKYDEACPFQNGFAKVGIGEYTIDAWGMIDKTGKEVIPCEYYNLSDFKDGYTYATMYGTRNYMIENRMGVFDENGNLTVPFKYRRISEFKNGLAEVSCYLDAKEGVIDKSGNEIIPCKYNAIYIQDEGIIHVILNGKCGILDCEGKEILPCDEYTFNDYLYGLTIVEKDGKFGGITKTGEISIPITYDACYFIKPLDLIFCANKTDDKYGNFTVHSIKPSE